MTSNINVHNYNKDKKGKYNNEFRYMNIKEETYFYIGFVVEFTLSK